MEDLGLDEVMDVEDLDLDLYGCLIEDMLTGAEQATTRFDLIFGLFLREKTIRMTKHK